MIRAIAGEVLLFLVPFAVFALYLILHRRNPLKWRAWSAQVSWLAIAGLACVVLALIYTGVTAEREAGPYRPSRLEDGRVVPGQFQ